jgi:hypothetical protein
MRRRKGAGGDGERFVPARSAATSQAARVVRRPASWSRRATPGHALTDPALPRLFCERRGWLLPLHGWLQSGFPG